MTKNQKDKIKVLLEKYNEILLVVTPKGNSSNFLEDVDKTITY